MTVTTPLNNFSVFAENGLRNFIPVTTTQQGSASMEKGFPEKNMQPRSLGGIPPSGKDMNGILNQLSSHQVFLNAGGMYRFDPAYAESEGYAAGSVLQLDDGLSAVISLVNGNSNNPNESMTDWAVYGGKLLIDKINYLNENIINIIYPVGIIVEFNNSVDPNVIYSGTVWSHYGKGRVTVGVSDISNDPTWTKDIGIIHGQFIHQLTISQLPPHNHDVNRFSGVIGDSIGESNNFESEPYEEQGPISSAKTGYTGEGDPFEMVQPSIVVARWCRIA